MDHFCAQLLNDREGMTFRHPAPPDLQPRLSRQGYPTEATSKKAVPQGRHNYHKL